MSDSYLRRFAIIGSGVAGLVSAHYLRRSGLDVRLFEKARGPGGRLSSKRLSDGSSVDIGAPVFKVTDPAFQAFIEKHAGESVLQRLDERPVLSETVEGNSVSSEGLAHVGVPRMSAFTRKLAEGLDIVSQCRIQRLAYRENAWWLESEDGAGFGPFDGVLVTAPPAQARELLAENTPLAEQFCHAEMRPRWVLAAGLDAKGFQGPESLSPEGPFDALWHDSAKPGRSHRLDWWVAHASYAWSEAHQEESPDVVATQLMAEIQRLFELEQPPEEYRIHRWLFSQPSASHDAVFGWDPGQRIGLCGDWLSTGDVQGAFTSASALVEAIVSEQKVNHAG